MTAKDRTHAPPSIDRGRGDVSALGSAATPVAASRDREDHPTSMARSVTAPSTMRVARCLTRGGWALLALGALSGCITWEGTGRFPAPVLEPVGQGRIVVVEDQHGQEDLLDLPDGALNSAAWPVRVDAQHVCFEVLIRLWHGAMLRSVKSEAWSFHLETARGEVAEVATSAPWTARRGPYGWEGTGVVCFPREGVDLGGAVELHAEEKVLELVFRWEPRS
jgi:hypothetical protein